MLRRSTRVRKAPVPIYVPDPDVVFEDDFTDPEENEEQEGGASSEDDDDDDYDESDDEYLDDELQDPNVALSKDGYIIDEFLVEEASDLDDDTDRTFTEESEEEDLSEDETDADQSSGSE